MSLTIEADLRSFQVPRSVVDAAREIGKLDAMVKIVGNEVANALKDHFARRHAENPNWRGAPRSGFWLDVRQSTHLVLHGNGAADVEVRDPRFAQKVYGGTIVPKAKQWLTIPVRAEAYNKRAGMIPGLFFLPPVPGRESAMLVKDTGGAFPEVYYVLAKRVNQRPDPEALPDLRVLREKAFERARRYVARQVRRANRGTA